MNTCRSCHVLFNPPPGHPEVECCGLLACRAEQRWTDDQWHGRARMAAAKVAAGVAPNELDLAALIRHPNPEVLPC